MVRLRVFVIAVSFILLAPVSYAQQDKELYREGIRDARKGNIDFAFMAFSELVRSYPSSSFFEDALFAVGEYYFLMADYRNAKSAFERIINSKKLDKIKLFSYVYLVKLADITKDSKKKKLEYLKKIITFKQITLLFRNSREIDYVSCLRKRYRAVYFIDRVEVYSDSKKFFEASF